MSTGMSLGWFLRRLFLVFGVLFLGLLLMIIGLFGLGLLRRVYFGPILKLEVLLKLAVLPFLVEVCYVFVTGFWEAGLLVAGVLAGYIGLVEVMRLMCIVLSTLLIPLLLLLYSFVHASSLLRICLKVFGVGVLLSLGGMLFWVFGRLCVVMVRVVPPLPWDEWIPPDLYGFHKWVFGQLNC